MNYRIIIADDHQLIAEGLERIINNMENVKVIQTVKDGLAAIKLMEDIEVDLVITDVDMPKMNGMDLLRHLQSNFPNTKSIVLSVHEESSIIRRAIELGASGYLLKKSDSSEIQHAVATVLNGGTFFSKDTAELLLRQTTTDADKKASSALAKVEQLTNREREILDLIVDGLSSQEIADQLHLSKRTIETHRNNLMQKLGMHKTVELVKFVIENGL